MINRDVKIKEICGVDIKVLADDGNEYIYSLQDFINTESSQLSVNGSGVCPPRKNRQ